MKGTLLSDRVVVFDLREAKELYSLGFYGKPLGENKPREVKSPLELSLIEALYLQSKGMLEVIYGDRKLTTNELKAVGNSKSQRFDQLYYVYRDLRDKGYVVRSGAKYGSDFAVYTVGPGVEHAPYLVTVVDVRAKLSPTELMGFGRVSHSVRKRLILAFVDAERERVEYVTFKWERV